MKVRLYKEGKYRNLQKASLFDLTSQEDLANWLRIKIVKAPIELKNIYFDKNTPRDTYFIQGFVEVKIGVTPDQTQFFANNSQPKKKKNGLKQYVTIKICAAMGDTLQNMETEIYRSSLNFRFPRVASSNLLEGSEPTDWSQIFIVQDDSKLIC